MTRFATHVAACAICADIVDVAGAIARGTRRQRDRDAHPVVCRDVVAGADARAPGSRARSRAADHVAQIVASISAVALVIAAVVVLSPWFGVVLGDWIAEAKAALTPTPTVVAAAATTLVQVWMIPASSSASRLLLAPVAIYFAVADD